MCEENVVFIGSEVDQEIVVESHSAVFHVDVQLHHGRTVPDQCTCEQPLFYDCTVAEALFYGVKLFDSLDVLGIELHVPGLENRVGHVEPATVETELEHLRRSV